MSVLTAEEHVRLLKLGELQFRLMIAVRMASSFGKQPLQVPVIFVFGKHSVKGAEIELDREEADKAAAVLEHTTTYTLSLQIVQAMKDVLGKPREHADSSVRASFEISRYIRNAYSHQPFRPHWSINKDDACTVFEVPGIACLDTTALHGKPVKWQDYGGMLAMFRLSTYVRSIILPTETVVIPPLLDGPTHVPELKPGDVIQMGRLMMSSIDRIPEGITPIRHDGPIILQAPDGTYRIIPRDS